MYDSIFSLSIIMHTDLTMKNSFRTLFSGRFEHFRESFSVTFNKVVNLVEREKVIKQDKLDL